MSTDKLITNNESKITEVIIGAAYEVSNTLGFGFLEKVYENSLKLELESRGLKVQNQVPITVFYKNYSVGEYIADLLVEDKVIVELKSVKELADIHKSQLLNYLVATKKPVGLLINFGKQNVEIKRVLNDS